MGPSGFPDYPTCIGSFPKEKDARYGRQSPPPYIRSIFREYCCLYLNLVHHLARAPGETESFNTLTAEYNRRRENGKDN